MERVKRVAILGSTGSVGTQALDVVRKHPDRFEIVALAAGSNAELLAEQVDEFGPALAVLVARDGEDAVLDVAAHARADVVLNALVGSRGLRPTLTALEAGKTVALANKESLIAGGELVMALVAGRPDRLLPVDSEHSALLQCLAGNRLGDVRRLLLTASGGPFRGKTSAELAHASVEDALAHPTWRMGRKITVDSATLMNKGLEAIEAHHLFDLPMDRIDIVVHPRSIVHGIVEFIDGSCLLQAARPDMHLPIQLALDWPNRLPDGAEPLDWASIGSLEFEPVDRSVFGAIDLAFEAARAGSTYPAVMNAANEEAVQAFLDERIAFPAIIEVVRAVLDAHTPDSATLDDVLEAERWARARANGVMP